MVMGTAERVLAVGWLLAFALAGFGNTSLGLLLVVGSLIAVWRSGRWSPSIDDWSHGLFLGLLGAMAVSAAFSPIPAVAAPLTFGYALVVFGFVFGAQWLAAQRDLLTKRLLPALAVGSTLAFAYATGRFFSAHLARAVGLFVAENGLGTLVILCGGVSLGYLSGLSGRWRYLTLPYLIVAASTLVLTFSRGAWLGFAAMLASFGLVRPSSRRWVILAMAVLLLFLAVNSLAASRFYSIFNLSNHTSRINIWRTTIEMIKDRPIVGLGAGVYMHIYPKYAPAWYPPADKVAAFAHNLFLQVAAEFGLIGLAVFVLILGRTLWAAWKLGKSGDPFFQGVFAGLVGVLIHQQVDIPIWGLEIGGAFWILCGLVLATYARERGLRPPSRERLNQ